MSAAATVRLAEIAESIEYGVTASASNDPVGPKFLRITDIQNGGVVWENVPWCVCNEREVASARLKPGDIVFARTGATTGKSFLVRDCPANAVFASYLIRVRLGEMADNRFVSHFFQTSDYWAQITKSARGVAQPGVNATTLKDLKIPLPPFPEQRCIADILDKADALRAKRRAAIQKLDELTQSIFLDMFGDPATNPKNWRKEAWAEICDTKLGKMLDQKQQTGEHRRRYIRNANVQWFRFDFTSLLEMDFDERDQKKFQLQQGDILICEGGEPGRAAIWRDELKDCYFQKALHRARANPKLATPEYLVWLLWFMAHRSLLTGVTAATIAHLTGEKLATLQVMLPPLALQQKFAKVTRTTAALATYHASGLAVTDNLFASLQHRAFRGEL